jgi:hypothetical protein
MKQAVKYQKRALELYADNIYIEENICKLIISDI